MNPSTPVQDLATQWKSARRLYPIYFELAREFAIDVKPCAELDAGVEMPGKEAVEQANRWLDELDQHIQVHQMRQFLQTSALVNPEGLLNLLQYFLAKTAKTDAMRDKIDFLLVQYFSQLAPAGVSDAEVDLAYVAQSLEPIVGEVELKPPVWLNALDRVLRPHETAVHSMSFCMAASWSRAARPKAWRGTCFICRSPWWLSPASDTSCGELFFDSCWATSTTFSKG